MLKSFKARLYLEEFLGDCLPIYPLYALMFAERSHLSVSEISILFGWWTLVALLAEVPTGIIADRFSRKRALIYALILQALGFAAWLIMPNFTGYAIGFLLWGVGFAFSSGTFQAYLYEELRAQGQQKEFNKVFARTQSLQLFGMVVAYLIASLIGPSNYTVALAISIAVSLIAAGLIVTFPYHSRTQNSTHEPERYIHTLVNAVKEVRGSRSILAYVGALAVIGGLVGTIEEYVPLFYEHIGFEVSLIPLLLAGGLLISTALGWYAHRFEHLSYIRVSLFVLAGGCLLLVGLFGDMWVALLGMVGLMRLLILAETLFNASLQHVIADQRRATVGSLASFGGDVVAIGLIGIVGVSAHIFGDTLMYRFLAIIVAVSGILLVILGRWSRASIRPPEGIEGIRVPGRSV